MTQRLESFLTKGGDSILSDPSYSEELQVCKDLQKIYLQQLTKATALISKAVPTGSSTLPNPYGKRKSKSQDGSAKKKANAFTSKRVDGDTPVFPVQLPIVRQATGLTMSRLFNSTVFRNKSTIPYGFSRPVDTPGLHAYADCAICKLALDHGKCTDISDISSKPFQTVIAAHLYFIKGIVIPFDVWMREQSWRDDVLTENQAKYLIGGRFVLGYSPQLNSLNLTYPCPEGFSFDINKQGHECVNKYVNIFRETSNFTFNY